MPYKEDDYRRNPLTSGNRRVGNNAAGRIARGQAQSRKSTSTPNMGRVVRTIRGSAGSVLSRTYQRPGGSRKTISLNKSSRGR